MMNGFQAARGCGRGRWVRLWVVGIGLLVFSGTLQGRDFFEAGSSLRFDLVDRSLGLSNLAVSAVVEDKHGFIWFGTQGGLNRYDGSAFRTYRHEPFEANALPHNLIQTMAYDRDRDVFWLGTYGGLARFDQQTGEFEHFESVLSAGDARLSSNLVIAVLPLEDGGVWVGTSAGLDYLNPERDTVTHYPVSGSVVRALHLDHAGSLWIGSNGGLSRFDQELERPVLLDNSMVHDPVMRITEPKPGVLELGVWEGGVVRYEVLSGAAERTVFEDNRVYSVLRTHDDTLWVATWGGGLFAVDSQGERHSFGYKDGEGELNHDVVYSLFQDSRLNLWIGTNGAGVHAVNPNKRDFSFAGVPALPRGRVQAIHRDGGGRLWIGVYGGGLVAVGPEDGRVEYYRADPENRFSLANDIVNRIYESPEGLLYVSSQGGLQRYRPESNDFELWGLDFYYGQELPDTIIYPVTKDQQGRYWIGTYNAGVVRYDPRTNERLSIRHDPERAGSLPDNLIYDILIDRRQMVWIASNNGLCRLDAEADAQFLQCYQHSPHDTGGISSSATRTLYEDNAGRLWIGSSSGGLSRYHAETDSFTHLTERDGLSDNTLSAILEDGFGRLRLATGRGVSLYYPDDTFVQALDEQSGLPVYEYNYGRLRDSDGSIVFAGIEGLVRIPPEFHMAESVAPQLHITELHAHTDGYEPTRPTHNDREIRLSAGVRNVAFSYAALTYGAPGGYRYRYRLAGFDDDWNSGDEHGTVSYAALPAGTFRFQVEAVHAVHGTQGSFAEVVVVVREYWWRSTAARIGYLMAGLLIVFAAVRLRERQVLLATNNELERSNSLLELANLELTRLSIHDPLTGLFNRRYFEENLSTEIVRARRDGTPIAVLMLDIDHFKQFNDHNGHIAGDRCLQAVSHVLKSAVRRPGDFAARYGGEELMVILPSTNAEGAHTVAEALQDELRRSTPVTASIGVCSRVPDADTVVADYVGCADKALYQAKDAGRDCIRVWSTG